MTHKRILGRSALYAAAWLAIAAAASGSSAAAPAPAAAWRALFDGKLHDAFRGWHSEGMPDGWHVVDGALAKEGNVDDLVTKAEFGNFELELEWKIGEAGNSGVFYRATREYDQIYWSGPEYQLLDDKKAEDNKQASHLAGSLYDIIAPTKPSENPAGQWNHTVIRLKDGELTFWLNGVQTVKTHLWDANWTDLVSKSKFKNWKGFAAFHKGHISLQDHGYHISFRNVKIREL